MQSEKLQMDVARQTGAIARSGEPFTDTFIATPGNL